MARLFDNAPPQEYLEMDTAVLTAVPITLACWFNTDENENRQTLVHLADSGSGSNAFNLLAAGNSSGDPVEATTYSSGGWDAAATSIGYTINTWHHACGVFVDNTDRRAYIDGGSEGTNTSSGTPTGIDRTSIGRSGDSSPGYYISGRIAEVGIWNAVLSAGEIASLGAGFSPILIRPQSLVAYWPLVRDEDQDIVGGYDLTAYNTPSIAAHPPIIYPVPQFIVSPSLVIPTRRVFITHT